MPSRKPCEADRWESTVVPGTECNPVGKPVDGRAADRWRQVAVSKVTWATPTWSRPPLGGVALPDCWAGGRSSSRRGAGTGAGREGVGAPRA
jgi:hypothetical protein